MTILDKHTLRRHHHATRKALPPHVRLEAAKAVCTQIQSLSVYQNAKCIALYQAIDGELDLHELWMMATQAHKICCMPVMNKTNKTLRFLPATPETPQHMNTHRIPEPKASPEDAIPLDQIDLMIMPLIAFDKHGTRLGRGAGYYDRTLANKKPACLLGAAYEFQHTPLLLSEPWDVPLDAIITEKTIHWSLS